MIVFISCCTSIFRLLECRCLFSISGQIVYHKTDNKILTIKQQIIISMMIQRETALQDEHDSYLTKIVCYSHNQITYWNESNF